MANKNKPQEKPDEVPGGKPQEIIELEWDKLYKCPSCGSTDRVVDKVYKEEVVRGYLQIINTNVCLDIQRFPVIFNKKPEAGDWVACIITHTDICEKCGTQYIFLVQKKFLRQRYQSGQKIILPDQHMNLPKDLKNN